MKHDIAECLDKLISELLEQSPVDDDDKLHLAVLAKIKERLYLKLGKHRTEYAITFTPAEAFALRILYTDYVKEHLTYIGNKLHLIASEVHKQYSI